MTVYFAHATSFCGSVWNPVIAGLEGVECVAWDFAGHGRGPETHVPIDWRLFGDQVLGETEPGGIGVGHSMGAAAMCMAQLTDPDRFRFLILIEPIIFPGPHGRLDHPLTLIAVRRRRAFESRRAALESWSAKGAFAGWDQLALEAYVECGLVGEGPVELACDPDLEADIYRGSNAHDTWERLGDIDIPVLVLAGEDSDTITPEFARHQVAQFASAGLEIVPQTGHFLPMENPALVADRVRRIVQTLG
jgi:pimeloyl-ACP methyl ester carboxylesterase